MQTTSGHAAAVTCRSRRAPWQAEDAGVAPRSTPQFMRLYARYMRLLWCTYCQLDHEEMAFALDRKRKRGRQAMCRIGTAAYYKRNVIKHKKATAARRRAEITRRKMWLNTYLDQHPCVDRGESDRLVLEFDHVRGVKGGCVTKMLWNQAPWRVIYEEIDKCDIRCANCHRRATHRRGNFSRLIEYGNPSLP